jgi:hypothetical protein
VGLEQAFERDPLSLIPPHLEVMRRKPQTISDHAERTAGVETAANDRRELGLRSFLERAGEFLIYLGDLVCKHRGAGADLGEELLELADLRVDRLEGFVRLLAGHLSIPPRRPRSASPRPCQPQPKPAKKSPMIAPVTIRAAIRSPLSGGRLSASSARCDGTAYRHTRNDGASSPGADHPENAIDVRYGVEALGVVLTDRGPDAKLERTDEVPVLIYVAGGIENSTCGIGR